MRPSTFQALLICILLNFLALSRPDLRAEEPRPDTPPTPPVPGTAVDTLLQHLRSDDAAEREDARRKLATLGEAIRPQVETALKAGGDADYIAQLRQLLKDLGNNDTLKRFDAPKTFTYRAQDKPVKDILAELATAYGWQILVTGTASEKVCSLNLSDATYFQALLALCDAAHLGFIVPDSENEEAQKSTFHVQLAELGENGICQAQAMGPFLLFTASTQCSRTSNKDFTTGVRSEAVNLIWTSYLLAEPGVPFSNLAARNFKLQDAKGNKINDLYASFELQNRDAVSDLRGTCLCLSTQGTAAQAYTEPFEASADLEATVPLRKETKNLQLAGGAGATVKFKNVSVTFNQLTKEQDLWFVDLKVIGQVEELLGSDLAGNAEEGPVARFGDTDSGEESEEAAKRQAGIFVLNAENHVIRSSQRSSKSGNGECSIQLGFSEEPVGLRMQVIDERIVRKYAIRVKPAAKP